MPDEPTLFDPPADPVAFDTDRRPPWSDPAAPMQIDTDLPLPLRGRSGNHDDRAVELLAALAEAGVSLDQVAHRLVDAVPAPPLDSADLRAVEAWLTNAAARCPDYWTGVSIRRAALDLRRQERRARRWAEHHEQALTKQAADIAAREAGTYWRDRDSRRVATKPVHIEISDESWSAFKAENLAGGETVGEILGALVRRAVAVGQPLDAPAHPGLRGQPGGGRRAQRFARAALDDECWRSFRALASVSGLTASRALGVLIERSIDPAGR